MSNTRKFDLMSTVYIVEIITFDIKSITAIVEIIDPLGNSTTYSQPFQDIDTTNWTDGMYTGIVRDGQFQVTTFVVKDPRAAANQLNELKQAIDEIEQVIKAKLTNGGVLSTSINNKSLVNESTEVLWRMKQALLRQYNKLKAKMNNKKSGNPIKSITTFKRIR
ncbi:hypothetical protein [Klebsiella pneumoniae]|uniref:hypothetical protein n=1 Tax=Klebsiella pneumoniae TaxID=573 RepID=UPI001CA3B1B2|nr:hypothetical protein [Klebsiella pneumoniae]MBY8447078.1 hypothetical protein [Klebsiella pneumoniae]